MMNLLHLVVVLSALTATQCLIMDNTGDRPPKITKFSTNETIFFKLGDQVQIECEATAQPLPVYKWNRNGFWFLPSGIDDRVIQQNGTGTIIFTSASEKDEGIYQCFVENKLGVSVSSKVNLRVAKLSDFPPEVLQTMYMTNGLPVTLPCIVPVSYPPAEIKWVVRKGNSNLKPVNLDLRVTMDLEGRLRFTSVNKSDEQDGNSYSCLAVNSMLQSQSLGPEFKLKVLGDTPMIHPAQELWSSPTSMLVLKGEELNLKFICSGNPTPTVYWSKTGGNLSAKAELRDFGLQLAIPDVQYEDNGVYQANCMNSVSPVPAKKLFSVFVKSAPKWKNPPRDVNAHPGDNATIVCDADGFPEPSVQWYINGVDMDKSHDIRVHSFRFLRPNGTAVSLTNLYLSDDMNIQCNASNIFGYVWGDVYINVTPWLVFASFIAVQTFHIEISS